VALVLLFSWFLVLGSWFLVLGSWFDSERKMQSVNLPHILFLPVILIVAVAMLLGMPALLALVLVVLAVCGYSVVMVRQRAGQADPQQYQVIWRAYQRQVVLVAGVGFACGIIALYLPGRPDFAGVVVLAVVVALLLGRVIRSVEQTQ
jgi:hypothetical protein